MLEGRHEHNNGGYQGAPTMPRKPRSPGSAHAFEERDPKRKLG